MNNLGILKLQVSCQEAVFPGKSIGWRATNFLSRLLLVPVIALTRFPFSYNSQCPVLSENQALNKAICCYQRERDDKMQPQTHRLLVSPNALLDYFEKGPKS